MSFEIQGFLILSSVIYRTIYIYIYIYIYITHIYIYITKYTSIISQIMCKILKHNINKQYIITDFKPRVRFPGLVYRNQNAELDKARLYWVEVGSWGLGFGVAGFGISRT